MAWTTITKPSVGDPTKKTAFADPVVDNLAFLYNQFLSVVGNREIIINGSFESDADGDGYPDAWSRTLYTGGSFTWDNSTASADGKSYHGKRSIQFTSPGGGGNGGGYVTSESFFEVSPGRPYKIQFATASTVADVHNKVEIKWYDSTQALISTTTVHDEAAANPTTWRTYEYLVEPPALSMYAKLLLYGCVDDDTTAGSTSYDDIRISSYAFDIQHRVIVDTAAESLSWKVPLTGWYGMVCVGAGGGGGGSDSGNGGGGGGGGGITFGVFRLTAAAVYLIAAGAGGAGGVANNDGAAGGNSAVAGTGVNLLGNGGSGGVRASSGGTGGAGGTSSGGRINATSDTGSTRSGATGGAGGAAAYLGLSGSGSSSADGYDCTRYGGGGGGAGGSGGSTDGGAGSAGYVEIFW